MLNKLISLYSSYFLKGRKLSLSASEIGHDINKKHIRAILSTEGVNVPNDLYLINNEGIVDINDNTNYNIYSLFDLLKINNNYFVKPSSGEKGKNSFVINNNNISKNEKDCILDNIIKIRNNDANREVLIQDYIKQHELLHNLNKSSVNTLRVITKKYNKSNIVKIIHNVLRIGRKDTIVDNSASGGLVINVKNGRTSGPAFDNNKNEYYYHPDNNKCLINLELPYWKEIIYQVYKAHSIFSYPQTIGWDIAFGDKNPIIIEANIRWDMELHVRVDNKFLYKIIK